MSERSTSELRPAPGAVGSSSHFVLVDPLYNVSFQSGPALGGAGSNWEQFQSAQVPSQLAPRSVELGAGPNWEQLVQLA